MLTNCKFSSRILRQILASISTSLQGVTSGLALGYSAVLLPQLKLDESFPYNAEYDSWIASIVPLAMAFGCLYVGSLLDRFGRRFCLISVVPLFMLGWFIMGFTTSVQLMLLGRFITGLCTGIVRPISIVFLSEVTDPANRARAFISLSLSMNIGTLLSHVIGGHLYWKTSALIFCVPLVISLAILLYLKESPLWLISKGKPVEGSKHFKWYRTQSEAGNKELEDVIKKKCAKMDLKGIFKIVLSKPFLKAQFICFILFIDAQFCGVNVIQFYALDLFKSAFSDRTDNFMVMVGADSIRLISTILVFVCVKYVPRRFIYLFCSFSTTFFILVLSLCFYYDDPSFIWLSLTCLIIYIGISSVLTSVAWSFVSEVYPNEARGLGSSITSTISYVLLFIAVKITPSIINTFGIPVLYFGMCTNTFVCSLILYFVLPETNGKTLQEIEDNLYDDERFNEKNSTNVSNQTRL